jgi:hypothetical protein
MTSRNSNDIKQSVIFFVALLGASTVVAAVLFGWLVYICSKAEETKSKKIAFGFALATTLLVPIAFLIIVLEDLLFSIPDFDGLVFGVGAILYCSMAVALVAFAILMNSDCSDRIFVRNYSIVTFVHVVIVLAIWSFFIYASQF